ncbi:MAG: radical SAM protein [Methanotrichaceae archaeon]|nr:radical SAM protein [Methanotrichaceae archaeon]
MKRATYNQLRRAELEDRIDQALSALESCRICPRRCGVDRLANERGYCRVGRRAIVSSYSPYFGEEPPLVGSRGSGTIFMAGCNMGCLYCQNYEISHLMEGQPVSAEELSAMMMRLAKAGCHNINFVTPTHVVPQILEALLIARDEGLDLPLVYNSGGYDSVETLRLLDGIIDIYMPDAKYADDETALRYSDSPGYPEMMKSAIKEMHRQVGDLVIEDGIAQRGLLVRHLVLPGGLAGTHEIVRFLSEEVSRRTYLNVMAQYRPVYEAFDHPPLDRRVSLEEFGEAISIAVRAGLDRGLAIY